MNGLPAHDLEQRAAEERQRLHSSVEELRFRLRDSLDLKKNTREHLGLVCGITALLGLAVGYWFTGIFVD